MRRLCDFALDDPGSSRPGLQGYKAKLEEFTAGKSVSRWAWVALSIFKE
jgi:hypothetical protein